MIVRLSMGGGKITKIETVESTEDGFKTTFIITATPIPGTLSLVACTDHGLSLFYIYRTKIGAKLGVKFRHVLNVIESDFLRNYKMTFKGLMWGVPKSTEYLGEYWLGLNNTLVISNGGKVSAALEDYMERHECMGAAVDGLLQGAKKIIEY